MKDSFCDAYWPNPVNNVTHAEAAVGDQVNPRCGAGVGFATPVWCGAWFGPNPTSGQYSQTAGTQRKTSPATATWQTDGNGR